MDQQLIQKIENIKSYGLTEDQAQMIITADLYLKGQGASFNKDFWLTPASTSLANEDQLRDEMYFFLSLFVSISHNLLKMSGGDGDESRFLKYSVAYASYLKSIVQTVLSCDECAVKDYYSDAFVLIRTLISKQNVFSIISLNPNIYDDWIKNPKELKYRDGTIRKELSKHDLEYTGLFYEEFSELVHGHIIALNDYGYFEKGIFSKTPPLRNKIYVQIKLTLAPICYFAIAIMKNSKYSTHKSDIDNYIGILDAMKSRLSPGRLEHLQNAIVEERNWEKMNKKETQAGPSFNFDKIFEQIEKFYRPGQAKKLNFPFNV